MDFKGMMKVANYGWFGEGRIDWMLYRECHSRCNGKVVSILSSGLASEVCGELHSGCGKSLKDSERIDVAFQCTYC
jgi:hypothetical protein